ncbi:MAG: hypothetical protein IJM09_02905 [Neisseriaceae bacterium]|nr:hypothetical protein [Neisseriaceae bacterium]
MMIVSLQNNNALFCGDIVVKLHNTNASDEPCRIIYTVAGKTALYSFEVYRP